MRLCPAHARCGGLYQALRSILVCSRSFRRKHVVLGRGRVTFVRHQSVVDKKWKIEPKPPHRQWIFPVLYQQISANISAHFAWDSHPKWTKKDLCSVKTNQKVNKVDFWKFNQIRQLDLVWYQDTWSDSNQRWDFVMGKGQWYYTSCSQQVLILETWKMRWLNTFATVH